MSPLVRGGVLVQSPAVYALGSRYRRAVVFIVLQLACTFSQSAQQGVEVTQGASIEQKMQIAARVVNEQALNQIKAQLAKTLPKITDEQLNSLGMRVVRSIAVTPVGEPSRETVTIVISTQNLSKAEADEVLEQVAKLVDEAVNGDRLPFWLQESHP
jgi:hypothetical protein